MVILSTKIANKFIDNKPDKGQFEFENKGRFAAGKLTWTDSGKDKEGNKVFKTSTKKFICFEANIEFIEQNLGSEFEIEGNLVGESFKDKDGKNVRYDQIVLNKVELFAKDLSKHSVDKGNGYQPQEEDTDDEIPF